MTYTTESNKIWQIKIDRFFILNKRNTLLVYDISNILSLSLVTRAAAKTPFSYISNCHKWVCTIFSLIFQILRSGSLLYWMRCANVWSILYISPHLSPLPSNKSPPRISPHVEAHFFAIRPLLPSNKPPWGLIEFYVKVETKQNWIKHPWG